jgi:uncharacterized protein
MSEPPSPCVQVCVVDSDGRYCLGCLRTLDEIAAWGSLSAAQKGAVLDALEQRAERLFVEND